MVRLQLQRFAGEKTERATPQRRREARREGQVARSVELTSAATLLTGVMILRITASRVWGGWLNFMRQSFSDASMQTSWTQGAVAELVHQTTMLFLELVGPLLGIVMIIGAVVGFAQVGPMFLPNLLIPKFQRINPGEGLKRLWSRRTLVEALKAVLKLVIIGGLAYHTALGIVPKVITLTGSDISTLPAIIGQLMYRIVIQIVILFVALAFLDYLFQRFEYERSIKMSREEIKQEYKQQEGDPLIRGQLRQRGRRIAMQRMMQEVPKADVVITNPTHLSVALRYDSTRMNAPEVVAKGQDEVALRIREVGRDADVPVIENRTLARELYRDVEIGGAVPEELFRAVAEVLAAVYRLRQNAERR